MDSGDGATRTSWRTAALHSNPPPADRRHTMGADQASRSVHDTLLLRKAKKPRLQPEVQMLNRLPPIRRNASKAYWFKAQDQSQEEEDSSISEQDSESKQHARYLAQYMRELKQGLKKLDVETEDGKVLSEKPVEFVCQSDAGNVDHLSEISSQQEQAKPPEGLPRSNKEVPYSMSDEYYDQLSKQARFNSARLRVVSRQKIIATSFKCVTEEALSAFRNYLAEKDSFEGFDHKFGEVLHHCFGAEYRKIYCHYNFTVEMKKNDMECWSSRLFFAEAKLVNGVKTYFCSQLEVTDDGPCYSCKIQCMKELKHPAEGDYEKVYDPTFSYLNDDEDPDDFD